MSAADITFINMCKDVIENGTSTEGEKVRPVWEDGTPAYTIKRFGVVNRYDLRKEFPALTLRKTALKSAMDEILWIWQKKSNNIHDLHSHIWDSWADETGSIGKAYGYQMQVKHQYREGMMDQVDRVLFDLKKDVTDLKKLVHDIMGGKMPINVTEPAESYPHPIPAVHSPSPIQEAVDVEEETMSLEEVEKEMIRKALEKHNGRRKNAAADLKISERTLYRKIKEYNLE